MNLLQEYIRQQTAPSMEAVDLFEMLSLESSVREDLASMGNGLNVITAINALDIDTLSNESYQVAVGSILTTAGLDDIPLAVVVPSFESSQALALSHGTPMHEEKVAKKKGILKRVWEFIKGLWQKLKARFKGLFQKNRAHTQALLIQQQKVETAAAAIGYSFTGEKAKAATGIGFDAPKTIRLGFLGRNPHEVAQGADKLAHAGVAFAGKVGDAFQKLLTIDYKKMPATKELPDIVGRFKDSVDLHGNHIEFVLGRSGAQCHVNGTQRSDVGVKPDDIPVKELVMARHAIVHAWDNHTKAMEAHQKHLDVLESICDRFERELTTITDPAKLEEQSNATAGLQRGLHFAAGLLSAPVGPVYQASLTEIDKLLGVGRQAE